MMAEFNYQKCLEYFYMLAEKLKDTHEVVGSCNMDKTLYLIPIGTECDITYHSKPKNSYRLSDHWNWYANLNKCDDEHYIQCFSRDLHWPLKRKRPGGPSEPIKCCSVGYYGDDNTYHIIFGETYDRKSKQWLWIAGK